MSEKAPKKKELLPLNYFTVPAIIAAIVIASFELSEQITGQDIIPGNTFFNVGDGFSPERALYGLGGIGIPALGFLAEAKRRKARERKPAQF